MKMFRNIVLGIASCMLLSCFSGDVTKDTTISFIDKVLPRHAIKIVQDGNGLVFAMHRNGWDKITIYPVSDTP